MKRYTLALFITLALSLSACSLKEPDLSSDLGVSYPVTLNPLVVRSIYTESYSLGYSGSQNRFSDVNPDSAGIQDRVIINLSAPFTVGDGGVEVKGVRGKVIGDVDFTYVVNNYEKRLVIYLSGIKDSTTYEVLLHSNLVKDLSGNFLDGNYNGKPDSSFDDFIAYFRGPNPDAGIPDNSPLSVMFTFFSDQISGDALTNDTLFVWLSRVVDSTTISGNFLLAKYPEGEDFSSHVSSYGIGSSGNIVFFVLSGLDDARGYTFILKNGIKDTAGRALDGNGNGIIEVEDNDTIFFNVAVGDSEAVEYPELDGINYDNTSIILEFSKPMDISTFGDSTVVVFDYNNNRVYSRLSLYPDKMHLKVEPMVPLSSGRIYLSRNLKDTSGLMFDGNSNGFGGEPGADDIYVSF